MSHRFIGIGLCIIVIPLARISQIDSEQESSVLIIADTIRNIEQGLYIYCFTIFVLNLITSQRIVSFHRNALTWIVGCAIYCHLFATDISLEHKLRFIDIAGHVPIPIADGVVLSEGLFGSGIRDAQRVACSEVRIVIIYEISYL